MKSFRYSLKQFLWVVVLVLVALPLILVGLLGRMATDKMSQDISQRNLSLANSLAGGVEEILERANHLLLEIRSGISQGMISPPLINEYLDAKVEYHPDFFNMILLLDQKGLVRYVAPFQRNYIGIDWSRHSAFKQAAPGGAVHWSSTFLSPRTGNPTVTLSVPMESGMLVGYLDLNKLSRILCRVNLGQNGFAAIVDQKGRAIAHSQASIVEQQYNLKKMPVVRQGLEGRGGVLRFSQEGGERLGGVALVPQTGWPVVVVQSVSEAFAPVRWMIYLILAGALFMGGLAFAAAFWLMKIVQKPLAVLASNAEKVAKGNYEFEPPKSGFAELAVLGSAFEAMIKAIQSREQDLKASQESIRALVESSSDSIITVDTQRRIISCNTAFLNKFGFSSAEILNHSTMLIHPDENSFAGFGHKVYPHIAEYGSWQGEWEFRRKDGSPIPVEFSMAPIRGPGGRVVAHVSIMRDISARKLREAERKRLETQLRQAQKMEAIGTLAGGIAHDFNNILAAIIGYSELGLNDARDGKSTTHEHERVLVAAERAKELVRQILTFSREAALELKPLNLNKEIADTVQIIERTIPKMISVELQLDPKVSLINGDANQIEQVFLNLANNANDAMPDGGRLLIETENITLNEAFVSKHLGASPGDYVLVTVSDNGLGMDKEELDHIFEPFYTTKPVGQGTGLGLASVYGIVQSHGGYIACYSELGIGTTFRIYLPTLKSSDQPGEANKEHAAVIPGGSETILLVDDEPALRDICEKVLSNYGYQIITAGNGEDALEIYRQQEAGPDLVILDINMPGMGGHKCLQELIKLNPKAKVLIASGYSFNAQAENPLAAGAAGYIAKPFNLKDLLQKVRKVLDQ